MKWDGEELHGITCTLQSLINTQDWTLNWIDILIQDKEYIVQSFEISSMFRTAVYFFSDLPGA